MPATSRVSYSFGGAFTPAVKVLMIANAIIWFNLQLAMDWGLRLFALQPDSVLHGRVWLLVTYLFLHPGVIHLLVNMYGLYLFGGQLESAWGTKKFLRFYFLTGIVGGIAVILASRVTPIEFVVGASGSIFGLVVAWAIMFPHQQICLLIPPVTLSARWFAIFWCGLQVAFLWEGGLGMGGVVAHVGGAAAGFAYMKLPRRRLSFDAQRLNPLAAYRRWQNHRIAQKFKVVVNEDFLSTRKDDRKSYLN